MGWRKGGMMVKYIRCCLSSHFCLCREKLQAKQIVLKVVKSQQQYQSWPGYGSEALCLWDHGLCHHHLYWQNRHSHSEPDEGDKVLGLAKKLPLQFQQIFSTSSNKELLWTQLVAFTGPLMNQSSSSLIWTWTGTWYGHGGTEAELYHSPCWSLQFGEEKKCSFNEE